MRAPLEDSWSDLDFHQWGGVSIFQRATEGLTCHYDLRVLLSEFTTVTAPQK